MSALETLERILNIDSLVNANLRFCLVDKDKHPYKVDGTLAQPNNPDDFVEVNELLIDGIEKYAGIGISVQASGICAIDVDHCFKSSFDIESIDERGLDILKRFQDAYCEFSFSGTGMRVLFRHDVIDGYTDKYYIKNSKNEIEYYQPSKSNRYVTVTGKPIVINSISECDDKILFNFLNDYMIRPIKDKREFAEIEEKPFDLLLELLRYHIFTNPHFQNVWYSKAPGSGADESERDFFIVSYLYEHITRNIETIRRLFEISPYFRSKDRKHINKWESNDYRYLKYMYSRIV